MTDLQEALTETLSEMADEAPPIGVLGERALAIGIRRRRHRRFATPTVGAMAVGITLALVFVVGMLRAEEQRYASAGRNHRVIELPEEVPPPLPAGGKVGAVDLIYHPLCDGVQVGPERTRCETWRLWRADGSTWRLTDIHVLDDFQTEAVLSPQGDRIAYQRSSDNAVVVRNLETGKVRAIGQGRPVAWSPDGRWLAVEGQDGGEETAPGRVVDTTTWRSTPLRVGGVILGSANSGRVAIVNSRETGYDTTVIDRGGAVIDLPREPVQSAQPSGSLTPDGARLVTLEPKGIDLDPDPDPDRLEVRVWDIERKRIVKHLSSSEISNADLSRQIGWLDKDTLVAMNNDGGATTEVYELNIRTGEAGRLITLEGAVPKGEGTNLSLATARLG